MFTKVRIMISYDDGMIGSTVVDNPEQARKIVKDVVDSLGKEGDHVRGISVWIMSEKEIKESQYLDDVGKQIDEGLLEDNKP